MYRSDWSEIYESPQKLMQDLPVVEYNGPGWYMHNMNKDGSEYDTMYIRELPNNRLDVHVWNGYDPRTDMYRMVMDKTRTDVGQWRPPEYRYKTPETDQDYDDEVTSMIRIVNDRYCDYIDYFKKTNDSFWRRAADVAKAALDGLEILADELKRNRG